MTSACTKKLFLSKLRSRCHCREKGQEPFQMHRGYKRKADKRSFEFLRGERSLGEEQMLTV